MMDLEEIIIKVIIRFITCIIIGIVAIKILFIHPITKELKKIRKILEYTYLDYPKEKYKQETKEKEELLKSTIKKIEIGILLILIPIIIFLLYTNIINNPTIIRLK